MRELRSAGLAEVKELIAVYERELTEITRARMATPLFALLEMLATESRALLSAFDRVRRDDSAYFEALGRTCEELGELLRQLDEFAGTHNILAHEETVRFVGGRLLMMEREYRVFLVGQARRLNHAVGE
jgi:hypothetical protein